MNRTVRGTLAALALLTAATFAAPLRAQTAADSAAIRAAALDYIDGWYAADAARMERALHPELAKRIVATDPQTGRSRLGQMGSSMLVAQTAAGGGRDIPPASRLDEVRILDIYNGTASVRVTATGWIDYMHLARWNGAWKIVNVLWQTEPRPAARP
ncbi:MAG TPA: nuclear transport factor 2 family protein [Longimicrobium sp.]|nr:nuclear transport factor 2 family protein [Longimicrobium sp.]